MNRPILLLAVISLLAFPLAASGVPAFLTHQGHILESNNSPVTGSANVTFKLYTNATGGSAVWTQTIAVTFDNGFYSVVLGPGTPTLSPDLFDVSALYLGVTLEGQEEFAPRHRMTSVPYALRAGDSESVTGEVNAVGGLTVDGQQIIDSSGNINASNMTLSGDLNLPHGTVGDMPSASDDNKGQLFYDTSENALYYSNGSEWVNVSSGGRDGPAGVPVINSVTPGQIEPETNVTLSIDGSAFEDGCEVWIDNTRIDNVTFVNSGQLQIETGTELTSGLYTIRTVNPNGLRDTNVDALIVDGSPEWVTVEGEIGRFSKHLSGDIFTFEATDPEGQDLTYTLTQGTLPGTLELNESTGLISGELPDVEEDTTYEIQITVTDTADTPNTVVGDFSFVVGISSIQMNQHRWRSQTSLSSTNTWMDLTGSDFIVNTAGGPLEIEINIPLFGGSSTGSHAACRPMIDGSWAGSFESLPESDKWHEGITQTYYSGMNVHRQWHRARIYYDVPAGQHTISAQCLSNSGATTGGRSSTDSLIITREYFEPNKIYQTVSTSATTLGVSGGMSKVPGTDLTIETTGQPVEISISLTIGNGGHAGCLEWMDDNLISTSPAYSNTFWYAGMETTYYGWIMWNHKRTYTGISAGSHTFSIRCYNDSGTLNMSRDNSASVIIVKELDETEFTSSQKVDAYANGWEITTGSANTWYTLANYTTTIDVQHGNLDIYQHVQHRSIAPNHYFTCRPLIDDQWAGSFAGLSWDANDQEGTNREVYEGAGWHGFWNRSRIYTDIPLGTHTLKLQCLSSGSGYNSSHHGQGSLLARDVEVISVD